MTGWQGKWRSTIRVRLTLLYAGAFFLAGLALVALMYFQLGQVLNQQLVVRTGFAEQVQEQSASEPQPAESQRFLFDDSQGLIRAQFQHVRSETLDTMLVASLIFLGFISVVAGAFGWLLAGHALQPLREITATARRVADRNLHERIALNGPDDEIKDLADTLDAMLERLDHAFDSQRRFIANASHELRTPLAINRTLIEVALMENKASNSHVNQLGNTLLAVNERHERLIDGLLMLASSEQRITEGVTVDLADVAQHLVAEAEENAKTAAVDLRTHLEPAPANGDPLLLERLAHNLIENAIRYNLPERGWIAVITGIKDGASYLSVENSGTPVPSYEVPTLFEPFRRLSGTERLAEAGKGSFGRGAGLGLSIVSAIAHAHGGQVQATSRQEGGLLITVTLPITPKGSSDSADMAGSISI